MKQTGKKFSYFLLVILLVLMSCTKEKDEELSYPLETAKLISHVTSDKISSKDEIQVRFVSPVIKDNLVGQILQKSVFFFDPSVEGVARWESNQILVFKPNQSLPFRQKYNGKLDLATLFPTHKDKLEPLNFNFEVAGRELLSVSLEPKIKNRNDPNILIYQGKITFSEGTELENVKNAITLKIGRKKLSLSWQPSDAQDQFYFVSEEIVRGEIPQKLYLTIQKKNLDISEDYSEGFSVPALQELQVTSVIQEQREEQPGFKIEFSEELDPNQDVNGLVRIEPPMDLKLKIIGNIIHVSGNFELGESYNLILNQGIHSRLASKLQKDYRKELKFDDIKPQIRFSSSGVFLPSSNLQKILFQTVNLSRVNIEIKKVFESNIGQFLQTERLNSNVNRREGFSDYYINRVGIQIYDSTLNIGVDKNVWLRHQLDLKNLIQPEEKGLFLLSLSFTQKDILYGNPQEMEIFNQQRGRYYGEDYYSNPYSQGYYYQNNRVYKPIVVSDIGLTVKKAHKHYIVFTTNILDARPMDAVRVTLRTYQNQVISEKRTGGDGRLAFNNVDEDVFYIEAEKNGQRSILKLNEMAWNLSSFDVGGEDVDPAGVGAFVYTERGVYRPGDEINLSVIARNENNTFPDNHPVTLQIFNPLNQKVYEATNRQATDGYYSFKYSTNSDDPTGSWRAEIKVGSRTFVHKLKIETVVPFRLKVDIDTDKEEVTWQDKKISFTITSTYLFGNPSSNLNAELNVSLRAVKKNFEKFKDYSFENKTIDFQTLTQTIFQGKLDNQGKSTVNWTLPLFEKVPSALQLDATAKVFEKGGRPNQNVTSIPMDPYPFYVGIQAPNLEYGYARVGNALNFSTIVVNPEGNLVPGREIILKIYRSRGYWWWEYENYRDYQLRFKSDTYTELIGVDTLYSKDTLLEVEFVPEERGQYLVEIQDSGERGHSAAFFIQASPWGGGMAGAKDAGELTLKTDKPKYAPGENAVISFPIPEKRSVLFSLDKGAAILESEWINPERGKDVVKITVPVTEEMAPTVYASISIIQPHDQTLNDRPIRLYGVVPINVEDPGTHQEIEIMMPEVLQSGENFRIEMQTVDKSPTQFTIAVVDEGLLALTRFVTPDPWKGFFKKQRLGVTTYDLFAYVIGANKGDIFKTFAIGGGILEAELYRQSQLEPRIAKRFKPVSMFKGPIQTNDRGKAVVEFIMPEYIGAVRVMVANARGNRYGQAEKSVPVKTDLMVMPSLPRVIGPEDEIVVPVTVFAMKKNMGQVEVELNLQGPLGQMNAEKKMVSFEETGEKDVFFRLKAKAAVGIGKIEITAKASDYSAKYETEIDIRASSPRISESKTTGIEPGEKLSLNIPDRGLPGSNKARISIQRLPNINFSHRLYWLIRYPYGCIEQIVSSVFPQLYLKTFLKNSHDAKKTERDIDQNINAAIRRLRSFQLASGAFTYWPGNRESSLWGTNYGGHFLIEAKKLGYNVPDDLMSEWLRYQKSLALTTNDQLMVRVYRVYLLALAGQPNMGAMNLLRQNNLKDMRNVERWLLAGAYQLAGIEDGARDILKNTGLSVKDYMEFGHTYGSTLRDKGIILEMLTLFKRWDEANQLAGEIGEVLSSDEWYSTQTLGYMLLAMGKYIKAIEGQSVESPLLAGYIKLPNGENVNFETPDISFNLDLNEGFGEKLEVYINKKTNAERAFVVLSWEGVPLKGDVLDESKNLILNVEWLNEDGIPINAASLVQGTTFWGHFKVDKGASVANQPIEELALVQLLPAGWEIENIRLSGEACPEWMSRWNLNREEYQDIRDDRVMWFFDFPRGNENFDFVVKLNAVTAGEFTLPPTLVEAMYNNRYKATQAGRRVTLISR
jgi:uncharacterized protein YfaS (alpha-2-macroglobulin family)